MICNPMMHGAAEEKEYILTRANGTQVKVKAGEFFLLTKSTDGPNLIPEVMAENGMEVPVTSSSSWPQLRQTERAPSAYYYYFVMPAQNVKEQR